MTNYARPQRERQKPSAFLSGAERGPTPVRFYEFDRFRLDTKRRLLMRDDEPVAIKGKALDTLVLLVQHAGQLLEKDELMNRLWPDTAVEEANLTQNIFEVRKALGEVPGEQRFIATVARRGYRFVAEVNAIGDETAAHEHLTAGDGRSTVALVGHARVTRRAIIHAGVATAIVVLVVGAGLYIAFRRSAPMISGRSSAPPSLTRLTYGPGLQTDVSWSPDGRRVAYAWNRDGNFDIWVQSIDGGDPMQVTNSPADETQPAWSPDGQRLVLLSDRDGGGLFTVDFRGGPLRRIAPYGRRPAWMPNGREVAFLDADMPRAAFIVAADGGGVPRRILETELSRTIWSASAIHPEGRISVLAPRAGFFVADRTNSRLQAVDASAAAALGLMEHDVIRRIRWSPTGTALIVEALSDGVPTLWRVPVEPGSLRWRTPERLTMAPASAQAAAVSPDGRRVAFTSAPASIRAWLFPFDANNARLTGDGRALTDDDLSIVSLNLTADGSTLCYGALEAGRSNFRLFRMDLGTGRTTFLTEAFEGVFSRSGRRVAYPLIRAGTTSAGAESTAIDPEYAVAVRDIDGREHLVSRWRPAAMHPGQWAPDDKAVLGFRFEGNLMDQNALVIWPIGPEAATQPKRVILESSGVNFWQARYSPNAQWISFVAQRMRNPGTVEIGIVAERSNHATTWTRIVDDHVWPDKPRWSPDGRTLYFLSRGADGYFNVWGVPIDPARGAQNGKPFQVTHFSSPNWRIDPDMSKGDFDLAGGRLVLPMESVKGSIWLLPIAGPW